MARPDKPPVTLDADRYISLEDNVALPLLYIGYPTVYLYHEDEAPLDVLMFILGQGETSLLYKNMVKNQIAVQAQATHGCQELSCQFAVLALPNPAAGKTLADLERIVRESLAEFEERGITDDDLLRTKMTIVSGKIYSLESVAGKVSQLAAYQYLTGKPDYAPRDVARYENVTKDDVMRVYEQYIKDKPAVIMSIVPHGQAAMRAREDTWERYERTLPDYEKVAAEELAYRRAEDDFDRSVIPPAGANPATTLPDIWRGELDNGIAVLGARNVETPTTTIRLRIAAAGQRNESVEQLGLAALTASMMNEATEQSSNEELSDRLQKLGSSVSFGAGNDDTVATVRSLTRNLDETLAILAEKLLQPKLAPEDFARVQAQTLQAIEQSKKQAASTAQVVYQQLLMGRDNPIAYLDMGTSATVAALTLDDVRGFYAAHYSPKVATIVAVSDLGRDQLLPKLAVLKSWQGPEVAAAPLKPFPETGGTRVYLVDKPNAVQSEIRIGKPALNYDATGEYYRAGLANFVLGGAFNSRINLNLREDKGYTYGARSMFVGEMDYGLFTAMAGVRRDTTAASIIEFDTEIRRYAKDGIQSDELAFTRNAIGQRDALRYETPRQKLTFLSRIQTYGLADDFVDQQNAILKSITADELNAIAAKHLTVDDMIIVVVGDRSAIEEDLQALGHDIVHLDPAGNVLAEA